MGAARALNLGARAARALAVLALAAGCAAPPVADGPLAQRVEAVVAPLVQAQQFSGAVALMRDGRIVLARGWGLANREQGTPFTPDTPSDGGSIAKTFTAAGLWALVHEGRLSMQQRVQALVPEYPHAEVTVEHLIAHSNGLAPDYAVLDAHFKPGQARTTPAWLAIAGREAPTPAFAPGSRFEYSNLAYDAAAAVIERVSAQTYAAFVRERFFAPHGLVHSFARPAHFADWPGPRTRGYRFRDGRWQDHDAHDDEAILGASNLIVSASDLARWGDAWAHARVLPAAAERAGREAPLIGGRRSAINGLSWYCAPDGRRCHYTGMHNAFFALVHWDRERRETVALVSNSALPPLQTVALQRALVDLLAGRPAPAADPAAAAGFRRIEAADRAALAGTYAVDGVGRVVLRTGGPGLQLQVDGGLVYDVFQVAREVFYVPGIDWCLAFRDGAQGPSLHVHGLYHQAVGARSAAE